MSTAVYTALCSTVEGISEINTGAATSCIKAASIFLPSRSPLALLHCRLPRLEVAYYLTWVFHLRIAADNTVFKNFTSSHSIRALDHCSIAPAQSFLSLTPWNQHCRKLETCMRHHLVQCAQRSKTTACIQCHVPTPWTQSVVRMELTVNTWSWCKGKLQPCLKGSYKLPISVQVSRKWNPWYSDRSPAEQSRWSAGKSLRSCCESLDLIRKGTFETVRTGVHTVIYNFEHRIWDLLRREGMNGIIDKHTPNCFDSGHAADKIRGKLLSTNICMVPIAAFIKRKTSETVGSRCVATKMGMRLRMKKLDWDANHTTAKLASLPRHTDLAPCSSPSDKERDVDSDICRPGHYSRTVQPPSLDGEEEKRSAASTRSTKSEELPSHSGSDSDTAHNHTQRVHRLKEEWFEVLYPVIPLL